MKRKMLELIKKKQGGGRSKNGNSQNDRKTCAKGLKFLINKRLSVKVEVGTEAFNSEK